MKAELAPKHTQKVGDNYVLWFEKQNSYVVISASTYPLLICYLESKDKISFCNHLVQRLDISHIEAENFYKDLSSFLTDLNSDVPSFETQNQLHTIPNPSISNQYVFGNSCIVINYASSRLQQLIHPYLHHALDKNNSSTDTVFDIFESNGHIYLFKNKALIGSYEAANYHFLQGKFAMELVTSIYNNTESDWLATFHASTVSNGQEAIMIIGDSGNGKSTLSAVLMAHGFDLLADDFTPMLAKNQHLYRFPAAISIKKGAFPLIEKLYDGFNVIEPQVSSSKRITVKYLPPSRPFKLSQKHFGCHKIVMVSYGSDVSSELRECPAENILETFIPDSWISPQPFHSKKFLNWVKDLKFYKLTYSDNDFAVAKFKELFDLQ